MQALHRTVRSIALAGAIGCGAVPGLANPPAPGAAKETAIEVCKPTGQREYLSRLVCAGGATPTFHRSGSVGMRDELPADASEKAVGDAIEKSMSFAPHEPGTPHHHMVDTYEVSCGTEKRTVYMDMYHCGAPAPDTAPAGLTLRAAASR
jgi:hypothetical protein